MSLDPVTALLDIGGKVIDRIWPDPTQAAQAKLELFKLQQSGDLAIIAGQLEINKVEAGSTNWFVAGARPFILWGCGVAMLYAALFEPLLRFVATVVFNYNGPFPVLDSSLTTQVLLGLLGLAGMRTAEKLNKAEGNR